MQPFQILQHEEPVKAAGVVPESAIGYLFAITLVRVQFLFLVPNSSTSRRSDKEASWLVKIKKKKKSGRAGSHDNASLPYSPIFPFHATQHEICNYVYGGPGHWIRRIPITRGAFGPFGLPSVPGKTGLCYGRSLFCRHLRIKHGELCRPKIVAWLSLPTLLQVFFSCTLGTVDNNIRDPFWVRD